MTDDVYVPINSNEEFHWVLVVVPLKERCIKVYDSMSSSRSNRKLSFELQKLSTMSPKYLELSESFSKKSKPTGQFLNVIKEITNLTHSKSDMLLVLPNKKAVVCKYHIIFLSYDYQNVMLLNFLIDDISCRDCRLFVVAYAEFLSNVLEVPPCGIVLTPFA